MSVVLTHNSHVGPVVACGTQVLFVPPSPHEPKQFQLNLPEIRPNNEAEGEVENGNSDGQPQPKKGGNNEPPVIVTLAVAPSGDSVAATFTNKQLVLYKKAESNSFEIEFQLPLTRKASKTVFTADGKWILVADKNGDVYRFSVEKEENRDLDRCLVLGHLSMLLDLAITPDSKFVLTADRDEKIRVSHFPNSYNINNFCLGHTDFVTSISLFPSHPSLLVSGSGDGTVRLWQFMHGKEIARINVKKWRKSQDSQPDPSADPEPASAVIKVVGLAAGSAQSSAAHFLVLVEGLKALRLCSYKVNGTNVSNGDANEESCSDVQRIDLEGAIIDFEVTSNDSLFVLTRDVLHGGEPLYCMQEYLLEVGDETVSYKAKSTRELNDTLNIFGSLAAEDSEEGVMQHLHKRWFDNMKEYLERKEARIKSEQARKAALAEGRCNQSRHASTSEPADKRVKLQS